MYAKGLVVGVVSTIMALRGVKFKEALREVAGLLPEGFSVDRLPDVFLEYI